jgi:hypothetical protein
MFVEGAIHFNYPGFISIGDGSVLKGDKIWVRNDSYYLRKDE